MPELSLLCGHHASSGRVLHLSFENVGADRMFQAFGLIAASPLRMAKPKD
jgi:hypothetical protein